MHDHLYAAVRATEARAARRARWSRVKLYAWPAVAFVLAFMLWLQGRYL